MNGSTALATIAVRPWRPMMELEGNRSVLNALDVLPRSRLYGPVPCEMGTIVNVKGIVSHALMEN